MGHKVSPVAFRIPYIKTWKSSWFAGKRDYKYNLSLDLEIRKILEVELRGIPIGDIFVSKEQELITIDIFTTKVVLVLGKTGENVEKIKKLLKNKVGYNVTINVKEIKKPDLNAKIVGYMIANQIEKRMPYKRAIKQSISRTMEKGAKGIKIKIGGRLNGADIARKETFKDGNIPTQTIRSDIDYCTTRAKTVYGIIGLKVWIYKGSIYKKK